MRPIRSLRTLTIAFATTLVLSACGGSDDTTSAPDDTASAPDDMATMTEGMDDMADDDDHESFAFGEAADEADADRTIEVEALDSLAYEPASVTVEEGETITFVVTNSGAAVHEFVIGDTHLQEEHEAEMQEMAESGMQMHDEPNALVLEAGETKSITWRFTQAGDLEFACHQPGHYAGGMKGTVTVS